MDKPVRLPEWASDIDALINEPTQAKKGTGWTTSTGDTTGVPEKPSLQSFNWYMNTVYENVKYLMEKSTFDLANPISVAGGILTPVVGGHVVVGEGGTVDDLELIDRTPIVDGDTLMLMGGSTISPVTIVHASAADTVNRIFTVTKENFVLDTQNKFIVLRRKGDDFYEVTRSNPSDSDFNPDDTLAHNIGSAARTWLASHIQTLYSTNLDSPDVDGTLNIGATNAEQINIGRVGATVALFGELFEVVGIDTIFTDKLLVLNSGGLPATGEGTGIAVEEGGTQTGYIKQALDRKSWLIKPSDGAEFELNDKSFATVGDVKHSILTESQFQTINGDKWEVAKGQAVSRVDYADLYALIGDTYGVGDGTTTFNLPDLTSKYLRAALADETDLNTERTQTTALNGITISDFTGDVALSGNTSNGGAQNINASTNGGGSQNINASTNINVTHPYANTGNINVGKSYPSSNANFIFRAQASASNQFASTKAGNTTGGRTSNTNDGGYNANGTNDWSGGIGGGRPEGFVITNWSTNVNNVASHNHGITVNNVAAHTHPLSGNVTITHGHTLTEDSETAPNSVILNAFIKVK